MIDYKSIDSSKFSLEEREKYLSELVIDKNVPHVFLKTCNRVELYWGEGEVPSDILNHLCRVASGLESSILGERAIQGQIKNAYQEACANYHLSPSLHKLFQTAMHIGKTVRSKTKISYGAMSHSQATIDIMKEKNIRLEDTVVTIIGVNKLTDDLLKFLKKKKSSGIFLANRHYDKVKELADRYGFEALSLEQKKIFLKFTDVLICATSAPHSLIHKEDIDPKNKMIIFDLSFPRDVDKEVESFENVQLYNLEYIEAYVKQNIDKRKNEISHAENIIREECRKFYEWYAREKEHVL